MIAYFFTQNCFKDDYDYYKGLSVIMAIAVLLRLKRTNKFVTWDELCLENHIPWDTGATSSSFLGGSIFDDVIVLIQPWYNFFANGHRYVHFATFPKMRTYWF